MKGPNVWSLKSLMKSAQENSTQISDGCWVPARPIGMIGLLHRLRTAWAVFTGKADAVYWPGGQ